MSYRAMNFGEFKDGRAQQPLPPLLIERESEISQFHDYCHDLMLKILRLFAIGLKIDDNRGGSEFLYVLYDPLLCIHSFMIVMSNKRVQPLTSAFISKSH